MTRTGLRVNHEGNRVILDLGPAGKLRLDPQKARTLADLISSAADRADGRSSSDPGPSEGLNTFLHDFLGINKF